MAWINLTDILLKKKAEHNIIYTFDSIERFWNSKINIT